MGEQNKSLNKLGGTAAIIMAATFLSRITGFLRTLLIYTKMRPGGYSDEFLLAFTLPDLMFNLLAGGAIAAALIPILSSYITKGKEKVGWKAVGTFLNITVIFIIITEIIFFIWTDHFLGFLAAGYNSGNAGNKSMLIGLTRILLLVAPFMMLAGQCNGILNSYKRFTVASFGPVVYNLCTIVSITIFGGVSPYLTAWGIVISAGVFFVIQFAATFKHFKFYKPRLYLKSPAFINLIKLAVPSLVASTIVEINLIISRSFATYLDKGMLTLLNNANRTWQLPLGIFAQSVGIVLLPTLSEHHAMDSYDDFKKVLYKGLRVVMLLSLPTTLLLMILNQDIMRLLFKWGNLSEADVFYGGIALLGYAAALIFASVTALLTRAFYAVQDSRTPLLSGLFQIFINYVINSLFQKFTNIGVGGTALAYSVAAFVNMMILLIAFNRKTGIDILYDNFRYVIKVAVAVLPASLVALVLSLLIRPDVSSKLSQILAIILPLAAGGGLFWLVAKKLKVPEIEYLNQMVMSRLKRS